ncbi:MAG: hypothetical protein HDKAJFGB_02153 [Anaerolineae bacterium]|nr:hypothetical protein [Anaerolineae bacterium]
MFMIGIPRGLMNFFHQPVRFDAFIQDRTYSQFFEFDFLSGVGKSGENDNGGIGNIGTHLPNSI